MNGAGEGPSITIDVEQLRAALIEDIGPATVTGSPFATADVVELEMSDSMTLIHKAESLGWDLRDFAV